MATEDEFIRRLSSFGYSEKEGRAYFHLLKYGPKSPSPLAKSLNTYREDVHRTLTSLIEKGMVRSSFGSPTIYTAVDLETALQSAINQHMSEMREMKARKQELQELALHQRLRRSDEVTTFKVLKSIREVVSVAAPLILSAEKEFLWIAPMNGLIMASLFGINDVVKELVEKGGQVRGITDITPSGIGLVQEVLALGEDVRHFNGYRGVFYGIFDRKHCTSAINIDVKRVALNESVSMLYTDDPIFADYLAATFETLWRQSVPAAQRIEELSKKSPTET
jgi:sugar-specific transcriptional regulator TrmB